MCRENLVLSKDIRFFYVVRQRLLFCIALFSDYDSRCHAVLGMYGMVISTDCHRRRRRQRRPPSSQAVMTSYANLQAEMREVKRPMYLIGPPLACRATLTSLLLSAYPVWYKIDPTQKSTAPMAHAIGCFRPPIKVMTA